MSLRTFSRKETCHGMSPRHFPGVQGWLFLEVLGWIINTWTFPKTFTKRFPENLFYRIAYWTLLNRIIKTLSPRDVLTKSRIRTKETKCMPVMDDACRLQNVYGKLGTQHNYVQISLKRITFTFAHTFLESMGIIPSWHVFLFLGPRRSLHKITSIGFVTFLGQIDPLEAGYMPFWLRHCVFGVNEQLLQQHFLSYVGALFWVFFLFPPSLLSAIIGPSTLISFPWRRCLLLRLHWSSVPPLVALARWKALSPLLARVHGHF